MAGLFGFFDYSKEGPGVSKDEAKKRGVSLFFDTLFRKFGRLVQLNLLFFVVSLPVLFVYFIAATNITGVLLQRISDMEYFLEASLLLNVMLAVGLLIFLGAGPASAGFIYVLRNYSTGNHAWLLSDFFENFKKNFKQGAGVLIIDLIFIFLISSNINFYTSGMAETLPPILQTVMSSFVFIFAIMFLMGKMYLYPMMVTFDLKLSQLYRNCSIFLLMKLPQTIGIFILCLATCALVSYLTLNYLIIGFLVTPIIIFSFVALIQMVYVYPVLMKVMNNNGTADEGNDTKNQGTD